MAKYEFGIMETPPLKGKRYDDYEPQKYPRLIAVIDDDFEPFLPLLKGRLYLHTLDIESDIIEWTGINLIPPETCGIFGEILSEADSLSELKKLFLTAYSENKFVIIFGL